MKTIMIALNGDPVEALYQLGMKEKSAFLLIESRVKKLLSTNPLLSYGHDLLSRAKLLLKKREGSLFDRCITSYSEGLGIDPARYYSFLALFELAAHYGQSYPALKGFLPGCTSVFIKKDDNISHARLLDFPLVGIFDQSPRVYYWQVPGKGPLLTYSCEGLAPVFFQGIHSAGISFAVHHKPGQGHHQEGQSIFQLIFESLFEANNFSDLKKELKKKVSMTKWSILLLDKTGQVLSMDIDGPAQNTESFDLNESSPLIFTNIPIQKETNGPDSFLKFSESRQRWLKDRLTHLKNVHLLDMMTNIEDQSTKGWTHPAATLSTVGAWEVNLSKGYVDVKEGDSALSASDAIIRINLGAQNELSLLKKSTPLKPFEVAWKRAAKAQSAFDQSDYDVAYHELQMAQGLVTHPVWKEILSFYLFLWDFKFVSNSKELSQIYKKVKLLHVPDILKDQWVLLVMRMEKRLDLSPTVTYQDVSVGLQELFRQEKMASKPVFATWMKLLYPRMEILDVFSPHQK